MHGSGGLPKNDVYGTLQAEVQNKVPRTMSGTIISRLHYFFPGYFHKLVSITFLHKAVKDFPGYFLIVDKMAVNATPYLAAS